MTKAIPNAKRGLGKTRCSWSEVDRANNSPSVDLSMLALQLVQHFSSSGGIISLSSTGRGWALPQVAAGRFSTQQNLEIFLEQCLNPVWTSLSPITKECLKARADQFLVIQFLPSQISHYKFLPGIYKFLLPHRNSFSWWIHLSPEH